MGHRTKAAAEVVALVVMVMVQRVLATGREQQLPVKEVVSQERVCWVWAEAAVAAVIVVARAAALGG